MNKKNNRSTTRLQAACMVSSKCLANSAIHTDSTWQRQHHVCSWNIQSRAGSREPHKLICHTLHMDTVRLRTSVPLRNSRMVKWGRKTSPEPPSTGRWVENGWKVKDLGELSKEARIFTRRKPRCADERTEARASREALFSKAGCLPSHFFGDDTPQPAAACEEASFYYQP